MIQMKNSKVQVGGMAATSLRNLDFSDVWDGTVDFTYKDTPDDDFDSYINRKIYSTF